MHVTLRDRSPRPGEPCADVDFDRVTFAVSSDGVAGSFDLFGGLSQGTVSLSPQEAAMITTRVAYIVEARVGTYESVAGDAPRRLACELDPTVHFDCPTTRQLDQLCLVWFRRPLQGTNG